jgi:hypothetical protein
MRVPVLVLLTSWSSLAFAQSSPEQTPEQAPEQPPASSDTSRVVVRGSVNFDAGGAINLGGTSTGARVALGANGGVGYLLTPRLSLDVDARLLLQFVPQFEFSTLEVIPGARFRPIDQLQLRVGVPIPLVPTPGFGVLAGAAFVQPLASRVSLVIGVDYTYYLTEYWRTVAPGGRIEVHGGVQAYF